MPTVYFVVGPPGSGKSTLLQSGDIPTSHHFDDFMGGSFKNRKRFTATKHIHEITYLIDTDEDVCLTDIRLCDTNFQREVAGVLSHTCPTIQFEWHCFENQPELCKSNVKFRNGPRVARELELIDKFSARYTSYPPGAIMREVVNAASMS